MFIIQPYYINKMKTTFYFNFFLPSFKEQGHHKHVDKEKLSINSFSLFTCKLVI